VILRSPAQAEEARAAQAARASAVTAKAETVGDTAAPGAASEMPSHSDGWASEADATAESDVPTAADPAPGAASEMPRHSDAWVFGSDASEAAAPVGGSPVGPDDAAVRREILSCVRQMARSESVEEFSFIKLFAAIVQVLALLALFIVFYKMLNEQIPHATLWALIAIALQMMSLTLFFGVKRR
jgi:hypothetical protein